MAQESYSYSFAFMGSFDDSRDVRHDEGLVVIVLDYSEVRFESGECIIGDLRFGCSDGCQQGGFARIGETYQADIGQKFEFQDEPTFLSFLSWLGISRSLVCRCLEIVVSETTASTPDGARFAAVTIAPSCSNWKKYRKS